MVMAMRMGEMLHTVMLTVLLLTLLGLTPETVEATLDENRYVLNEMPGVTSSDLLEEAEDDLFQNSVMGIVTDEQTGESLPGVNIVLKGTNTGTSTDITGAFELSVTSLNDTLVVSYIGYQLQEIPIDGRAQLEIVLIRYCTEYGNLEEIFS
jgi:hypothetical protein